MTTHSSDGLPPLRDVIAAYDLAAKKSFGQHFLLDLNLTSKIARAANVKGNTPVIEIGPGPGGLTRGLLMEGATNVTVIERDPRFLPALNDIATAYPNCLKIIEADALDVDERALLTQTPAKVVSNLPYNIGTPLLIKWLTSDPCWFDSLTLMFQKEVGDRIIAKPGSKTYGRLSVLSQWRCRTHKMLDVPARAFTPPPKVNSTVVQLIPRDGLDVSFMDPLQKVTAAAFGKRRKMLRASLKQVTRDAEGLLHSLGIDPTRRAESLSIDEFVKIAHALHQ